MAEDPQAETPAAVSANWYVWHRNTQTLKSFFEEEARVAAEEKKGEGGEGKKEREELKRYPVDELSVKSSLGFRLSTTMHVNDMGPEQGLYLRHVDLLYGRPVYESENRDSDNHGHFLYWMANGGSHGAGMSENDEVNGDDGLKRLMQKKGYWVFSRFVGAVKNSEDILAFSDDPAVTPNQ